VLSQGASEERALEINEGLAEYTGIRVSLPEGARAGWTVQRMESRESQAEEGGTTRNFAYATGPGYGLLLDAVEPGWHESVSRSSDLGELLARAYGFDVGPELAADAGVRMVRHGGDELLELESAREEERTREQTRFRARYVTGPVLILPADDELGYSFDPNGVAALEGAGQVLATAEVRGKWGTIEATGGVLLKKDERGVSAAVVPAPSVPDARPLSGDGWRLVLRDGWVLVPGARPGD